MGRRVGNARAGKFDRDARANAARARRRKAQTPRALALPAERKEDANQPLRLRASGTAARLGASSTLATVALSSHRDEPCAPLVLLTPAETKRASKRWRRGALRLSIRMETIAMKAEDAPEKCRLQEDIENDKFCVFIDDLMQKCRDSA